MPRFVGDVTDGNTVALDDFFKDKEINFIKADIEGAERLMLKGGKITFTEKADRALLCQYHKADDEKVIKAKLSEYGFSYRDNEGYMLFLFDENGLLPPYVRHGVLYAVRGQSN